MSGDMVVLPCVMFVKNAAILSLSCCHDDTCSQAGRADGPACTSDSSCWLMSMYRKAIAVRLTSFCKQTQTLHYIAHYTATFCAFIWIQTTSRLYLRDIDWQVGGAKSRWQLKEESCCVERTYGMLQVHHFTQIYGTRLKKVSQISRAKWGRVSQHLNKYLLYLYTYTTIVKKFSFRAKCQTVANPSQLWSKFKLNLRHKFFNEIHHFSALIANWLWSCGFCS